MVSARKHPDRNPIPVLAEWPMLLSIGLPTFPIHPVHFPFLFAYLACAFFFSPELLGLACSRLSLHSYRSLRLGSSSRFCLFLYTSHSFRLRSLFVILSLYIPTEALTPVTVDPGLWTVQCDLLSSHFCAVPRTSLGGCLSMAAPAHSRSLPALLSLIYLVFNSSYTFLCLGSSWCF